MQTTAKYIVTGIAIGIIIFLFLGGIIISFVIEYRKRQKHHKQEMLFAKMEFEKEVLISNLETQEQIFNTISQEIHDNVGQILSLAKVQLNIIDQKEAVDKKVLEEAKENISKAMADLRDIAKSLSSDRIKDIGLQNAVQQEQQRINRSGILDVSFTASGSVQYIVPSREMIIFRIIQECMQNTIKHAGANSMSIRFEYLPDELKITIEDDGNGFDQHKKTIDTEGLGLRNMVARIGQIRGNICIETMPGDGTSIILNIPYEQYP